MEPWSEGVRARQEIGEVGLEFEMLLCLYFYCPSELGLGAQFVRRAKKVAPTVSSLHN